MALAAGSGILHQAWAQSAPARAAAATPAAQAAARAAYAAAIDKVEQLRLVESAVREQQAHATNTSRYLEELKAQVQRSREALGGAATAIDATSDCRRVVIRDVEAGLQIVAEFREAAEQSLAAAAELSRRPDALADRLTESSLVFQRRHEKKREMTNVAARLPDRSSECGRLMEEAQASIEAAWGASLAVGSGARALAAEVDQLRRTAAAANARIAAVGARGWLAAKPGPVASAAPATRRLGEQASALAGIEQLRLRDPSPDLPRQLLAYQDAALRLVVEQDARQFLTALAEDGARDCTARECDQLLQDLAAQRERTATDALDPVNRLLLDVARALAANAGFGILASDAARWRDAQQAVEGALAGAVAEVTPIVEAAHGYAKTVEKSIETALARAIAERGVAHVGVFGSPEEPDVSLVRGVQTEEARLASEELLTAGVSMPDVRRHAFEVLTLRATESEGYGAYTYVILPVRSGAAPEYQALLSAIVRLTPVARADEAAAVKRITNLFVIPGNRAAPVPREEAPQFAANVANYDWSRALSLVQVASDGVLATGEVLRRFRKSPGPFLLTLPVPIARATGTTNLLLADLNGYPASGFDDLVKSYQNDLVDAFPTNQTLWTPPWRVRTALALVRIGHLAGGQNLIALAQP